MVMDFVDSIPPVAFTLTSAVPLAGNRGGKISGVSCGLRGLRRRVNHASTQGAAAASKCRKRRRERCQMSGDAIDAVDHGEDIEVECLFYAITRRSNSDYERVAVVLGPQDVRLMFIDWSAPQNPCSWREPALPLQEPVRVECLSYVFTWPDLCLRRSKVRLPDLPNMEPLEFQDRGAFAQSMYSPGAGPWLDDYVDVFAAVCLMAEDGEPVAGRPGA
ncbi:unnamed protein product [Cladocopium goreaui]|uniref:E3 ubiquitin-protein ligase HERC2 n=1 Tax=Cladocopium goreaui TaxID=2562237 RepID=A0A9P1BQV0_9DINO|nr:unnamed protein product [Cladocopium goreaui]